MSGSSIPSNSDLSIPLFLSPIISKKYIASHKSPIFHVYHREEGEDEEFFAASYLQVHCNCYLLLIDALHKKPLMQLIPRTMLQHAEIYRAEGFFDGILDDFLGCIWLSLVDVFLLG